ncbi:LuxR C-terminal-related transcriptional regulator [Ruminococcus gauvreauii]|uniref:LuxR C-terminal-related transcriptional regulator n=1 Tax=Ruminococcus gauvreauii TaxID=438033 RepID=A0ABY5VGK6_9FIRM|nr:LuxR C-terminal-related transcriptional regulator [Ruminococcus gauvreauii]UWP59396.1 LuxR C-terminal-related transcriptional regulator [Ruminococcus gauvreauii]
MDFNGEKYTPASLPGLCAPRNQLLVKLDSKSDRRLLYIQAPAGYGKTVVTNLWLKKSGVRHLWIALDEYDNNPELFYRLLCSAVIYTQEKTEIPLEMDSTGMFCSSPIEHAMLLTSRFRAPKQPIYIVMDDLHSITQDDILQSLPYFIRRLPVDYRFIMISRTDIPAKLQEVFDGHCHYLCANDLVFSKMEIQELFRLAGHELKTSETDTVMEKTGGWAIAVSTLASGNLLPELVRESGDALYRYMEKQIWSGLSSQDKLMLLKVSFVNDFSAELFGRLTSQKKPEQVISQFLLKNLFLSRIGNDLYRFHALFLEFLRSRQEELRMDSKKLYKIAAQYYSEKEDLYTARHYAILGDNIKFLSYQIYGESQYTGFSNNRSISAYVSGVGVYIDKLSMEAYKKYPYLNISSVWYHYLTGSRVKMTEALDRLYSNVKRIALLHPEFLELTILVCTLDPRKKFMEMIQRFDRLPPIKVRHGGQQGASITVNMPFAHRCLRDYSEFSLYESFDVKLEPTAGLMLKRNFKLAMRLIQAGFAYEKNQWKEALFYCDQADMEISEDTSDELLFTAMSHRWTVLNAMGKDAESRELSARIEKMLMEKDALYLMPNYKALRTEASLREGNRQAAEEWLEEYFVHPEERLMLYRTYQYLTTIQALLALNRLEEAGRMCQRLRKLSGEFDREIDMAESDVLLSVCLYRSFRMEEAVQTMMGAIELLYPYRFIRPFSGLGASVVPVLKKCLAKLERHQELYSFDRRYINEIYIAAQEQAGRKSGLPSSDVPLKKLSKQQRRMIEYLAKGYTNADIAEDTGLSVRTVKTHLFLAYEKLGVSSAAEAVSKARKMGII